MTADPLLEVSELRISFRTELGPANVLDAVNLAVGRGRIMGLVGESGCGKTTLARAVLGILPPNARTEAGTIRFDGLDLLGMERGRIRRKPRRHRIAFIPQDPYSAFNPLFRIGDQIMELMKWNSPRRLANEPGLGALFTPYPRERYRADKAAAIAMLNEVQIPDPERAFRKLPEQFSGGQRQRLMIAMALLMHPGLVIADEPTTALDVTIQAQILKLLKSLAKERGVSVLLTTHDLATAYEICDEITVMYAGQEVETAPVAAFFANPRHPYTARLLECLPDPARQTREMGGEIPNMLSPPAGCRFQPRCARASAICSQTRPPAVGGRQVVRCFHPHPSRLETAP
jgi:peptide/nickel transport system ATP-binding protein